MRTAVRFFFLQLADRLLLLGSLVVAFRSQAIAFGRRVVLHSADRGHFVFGRQVIAYRYQVYQIEYCILADRIFHSAICLSHSAIRLLHSADKLFGIRQTSYCFRQSGHCFQWTGNRIRQTGYFIRQPSYSVPRYVYYDIFFRRRFASFTMMYRIRQTRCVTAFSTHIITIIAFGRQAITGVHI